MSSSNVNWRSSVLNEMKCVSNRKVCVGFTVDSRRGQSYDGKHFACEVLALGQLARLGELGKSQALDKLITAPTNGQQRY